MRRGYVFIPVSIILICTIFSGGCSRRPTRGLMQEPVAAPPAAVEQGGQEESFGTTLTRHLSLPPEQQEDLHAKAVAHLKDVRKFQWESYQARDSKLRYHFYQGVYIDRDTWGVGLGNSIHDLQQACKLDPSYAEAWGLLGHFYASAGDPYKGRESLDRARLAIIARNQTDRPVDREVQLEIFRNRAWVLRDLGLWEEGLDAVQEGLRFRRGDRDLVLLKGLCLAGAGRYEDAVSLAVRMKPFEYPKFDLFHIGSSQQTSDYANRWIKSQAALAVGDYAQARHVLGGLESYPYRWYMPHQNRFFRDVGLAAELVDDPEAATYYAIALISDPYYGFFPYMAGNLLPLVQDVPDPYLPYFTSFGGRFYLGGSLLSYAARQMNMMSLSVFEMQRSQAAWRALQALNIAERRNIRPDVVRALRGRVYFSQDELALARQDLTAASEAFRKEGRPDAGTSLLMGLLEMNEGRYQEAVPQLQEAVLTDPELAVGWRSLGVSLARLNRADQAAQAMDQALELEPRSVSGLYNRGLLHLQNQDFARAGACLERAYQLDPENHEVQRLLQMSAASLKASGGDPALIQELATQGEAAAAERGAMTPEEMLASLEKDIQTFFDVPDSLRETMGTEDQVVASLRAQWYASGELVVRKILALAYLDREMYSEAQELLAPGWGVDLAPEEEIMLLYADRTLGEQKRSRQLADMLLKGEKGLGNPYLLTMLPNLDRRHWLQTILNNNHYMEGYSAKDLQGNPDAEKYAMAMRLGWHNIRMGLGSVEQSQPFFRFRNGMAAEAGVASAVSGARPTSAKKVGNVRK
jgi:tetratricopeptide (TPR) repeat protein